MKQFILRFIILTVVASRIDEQTKRSVPETTGNLLDIRFFPNDRVVHDAERKSLN